MAQFPRRPRRRHGQWSRAARAGPGVAGRLMVNVYKLAMIVHIYSAIVLVGSMFFNAFILGPALRRIPPAQAATAGDKIGAGLRIAGPVSLVLLGITGFLRANYNRFLWKKFFQWSFMSTRYGSRIWLMFVAWLVLVVTG